MRTWPDLPPLHSVDLTQYSLQSSDAVLIVTGHSAVYYELSSAMADLNNNTRGVYDSGKASIVQAYSQDAQRTKPTGFAL
jgi:hypothetical protein